ncbi:MAG TPA: hypothetical protein VMF31_11810 [Solirubrobacterales bacterium]|nr:hypothetical protein [Solirubrobacterales bacterium]
MASRWKVTVRYGSDVSREGFDDLDQAIAAAEAATDEVLGDDPLSTVKAFRDYTPDQLVKARIEITGKGLISPPTAGLDIQGDGGMLAFTGGVRRKALKANSRKQVFAAIRQALEQ